MNNTKPFTDGLFYKKEEIDGELKCPSCSHLFESPRLLPCGDSICFGCVELAIDQSNMHNNSSYECPACHEVHTIDIQTLPRNKILEKLLNKEASEVYRNKNVEELKAKLAKLNLKAKKLENYLSFPRETIQEHFKSLQNQIDLATEKAHQLINQYHDFLFNQVKDYENECLDHFVASDENNISYSDFQSIDTLLNETREFFEQKVEYLKKFNVKDEEIDKSLLYSDNFFFKIKDNLLTIESNLFKTGKRKFVENTKELTCELLGELRTYPEVQERKKEFQTTLSYPCNFSSYQIFDAHLTTDDKVIAIASAKDCVYVKLIDQISEICEKLFNSNRIESQTIWQLGRGGEVSRQ